jgi:membrane protease YdiL (CAAX protease family)
MRRLGDDETMTDQTERDARKVYIYFALACAMTWLLALPVASAWMRHEAPPPYGIACAGLSAFGPLFATLAVTTRLERRGVFGRWRVNPPWVLLSLFACAVIHVTATLLYAVFVGPPSAWLHPPQNAEALAALVVFPLGEEFGWRGFAYPRLTKRFGLVKGSLLLGTMWGLWHLGYGVTPEKAAFDPMEFGIGMVELPLYSLLMAWVLERTNRSMAVAIAFHAGAHLDHIERARDAGIGLQAFHVAVVFVLAVAAARSLAKTSAPVALASAGVVPET